MIYLLLIPPICLLFFYQDEQKWNLFLQEVFTWTEHSRAEVQQGALSIFTLIVESEPSLFERHIPALVNLFGKVFTTNTSSATQIIAIDSLALILGSLGGKKKNLSLFQTLAPAIIQTMLNTLSAGRYEDANNIIAHLITITEARASFFRPVYERLLSVLFNIIRTCCQAEEASISQRSSPSASQPQPNTQSLSLSESTLHAMQELRHIALELILQLSKAFALPLKKTSKHGEDMLDAVSRSMLLFQEPPDWAITRSVSFFFFKFSSVFVWFTWELSGYLGIFVVYLSCIRSLISMTRLSLRM